MEKETLKEEVGGTHYKKMAIEPVVYCHANNLDFFAGNIVKYVTRYKYKNGKEDLLKARHYIDMLIEFEYGDKEKGDENVDEVKSLLPMQDSEAELKKKGLTNSQIHNIFNK